MKRKALIIAICVLAVVLAAEVVVLGVALSRENRLDQPQDTQPSTTESTEPSSTASSTEPSSEAPTEEEPTEEPTEEEPTEERYILTFVGDCTLASAPKHTTNPGGFIMTVGEDYDYPFANVVQYFENDDFTMINLESVLADSGNPAAGKTFTFKGPTAYTQILTGSSVEAVTLANNHTMDYGKAGYASTKTALEEAGVAYVEANNTLIYTTESGLVIGIYAVSFDVDTADMRKDIGALRNSGVDIIIAAMHWGNEGKYRPNANQEKYGHAAIDAGADIVYGHHPHVLQRIEEYNGGIIYYSLGNFCFGGNHFPRDMDSVIVQQEVIRDAEGNISLGELILIPVSISSTTKQNDFQPTPYEVGSEEYERTMSKLNGTFTGPDLDVDYSFLEGDKDQGTEGDSDNEGDTGGDAGGDTGSDAGGDAGGDTGGDTGSDAGGDTGGDAPAPEPEATPDAGTGTEG